MGTAPSTPTISQEEFMHGRKGFYCSVVDGEQTKSFCVICILDEKGKAQHVESALEITDLELEKQSLFPDDPGYSYEGVSLFQGHTLLLPESSSVERLKQKIDKRGAGGAGGTTKGVVPECSDLSDKLEQYPLIKIGIAEFYTAISANGTEFTAEASIKKLCDCLNHI